MSHGDIQIAARQNLDHRPTYIPAAHTAPGT
jgi:hypothetical protein